MYSMVVAHSAFSFSLLVVVLIVVHFRLFFSMGSSRLRHLYCLGMCGGCTTEFTELLDAKASPLCANIRFKHHNRC